MGDYPDVYYQVLSKEETELLRKEITFHPNHLARQVLWITLSSILFWIIVFNGKHWIETRCVVWNIFDVQNISSSEKAIFPSIGKEYFSFVRKSYFMLIGRYATDELENVITPTPNQNIYLVHHTHILICILYVIWTPNAASHYTEDKFSSLTSTTSTTSSSSSSTSSTSSWDLELQKILPSQSDSNHFAP